MGLAIEGRPDVTHDELVDYCMSRPGATPDEPWEGDLVAKVGGKVFAFLGSDNGPGSAVTLKCGNDSDETAELRARFPGSVTISAYIGRHGWNRILLDGAIDDDELRELVDASYSTVVAKLPKRLRP